MVEKLQVFENWRKEEKSCFWVSIWGYCSEFERMMCREKCEILVRGVWIWCRCVVCVNGCWVISVWKFEILENLKFPKSGPLLQRSYHRIFFWEASYVGLIKTCQNIMLLPVFDQKWLQERAFPLSARLNGTWSPHLLQQPYLTALWHIYFSESTH